MKGIYVRAVRLLRSGLRVVGLLKPLDRWSDRSDLGKWILSLLYIYDAESLVQLDLPWWTLDSARRVETFLRGRRDPRVFEWGSGASSVWLSRRAGEVISVEHDPAWYEEMRPLIPSNGSLRLVPALQGPRPRVISRKPGFEGLDFSDYVDAIDSTVGDFDLIVIDGRAREACLDKAVTRLAPGGLIVFDNVDRARYRAAIEASHAPLEIRWTRGRTPCLPYPTRTALISRSHE